MFKIEFQEHLSNSPALIIDTSGQVVGSMLQDAARELLEADDLFEEA